MVVGGEHAILSSVVGNHEERVTLGAVLLGAERDGRTARDLAALTAEISDVLFAVCRATPFAQARPRS